MVMADGRNAGGVHRNHIYQWVEKKTIAMFGYLNIPEGISFVPC